MNCQLKLVRLYTTKRGYVVFINRIWLIVEMVSLILEKFGI